MAAVLPMRDEAFDYLESQLDSAPFLVASNLSVADVAVGAQLITYHQGEGAMGAWPRLARYFEGLLQRPAWAALVAEETQALEMARARRR